VFSLVHTLTFLKLVLSTPVSHLAASLFPVNRTTAGVTNVPKVS
jgi:hypothetical protein